MGCCKLFFEVTYTEIAAIETLLLRCELTCGIHLRQLIFRGFSYSKILTVMVANSKDDESSENWQKNVSECFFESFFKSF